jgi:hypothetical protein
LFKNTRSLKGDFKSRVIDRLMALTEPVGKFGEQSKETTILKRTYFKGGENKSRDETKIGDDSRVGRNK